jgi:WD40 repeat protein
MFRIITLVVLIGSTNLLFGADRSLSLKHLWTALGDRSGAVDMDNDTASVESVEFSPDGRFVVSGSKGVMKDGKRVGQAVKLWRVADGKEIWTRERADEVEAVSFSRNGQFIAAGGEDNQIELLRSSDGSLIRALSLQASCDALRFTPDGKFLAIGDEAQQISIYKVSNWTIQNVVKHGGMADNAVNSIDFTHDNHLMASGGSNGEVKVWRFLNGKAFLINSIRAGAAVKSVRISPDGKFLAAGVGMGLGVKVWTLKDGVPIVTLTLHTTDPLTMEAVEWTPDSRYLVTGGTEGRISDGIGYIRFYKTSDLILKKTEPALKQRVFRQEYIHFSKSGEMMVSGHEDGTLRVWRVLR